MIRTAIYAWAVGFGLVFGSALVLDPNPLASAPPGAGRMPVAARAATETPSTGTPSTGTPSTEAQPAPSPASDPQPPVPVLAPPMPLADPEPPAPIPVPATPVAVQFDGVPPSQIVGDRVNLDLATAGNIKSYAWTVMPPGTVGLKVYDGGSKADFTSRFPGTYVFLVAVAGADCSVAQAFHAVELRADTSAAAPADTAACAPAMVPPKPPTSDPTSLVKQWTAEVKSPNRRAEQLQIANGFRQAAGAIDGGMFAGGNLFGQTKTLCAMTLGGTLGAWEPWFDKVEQLYRQFDRMQLLGAPANFSAANKSVAKALETMSDEP